MGHIFNTYGKRVHPNDGRVVGNLIVQALQVHDTTLYGDGLQTRSFRYMDDLIEGLIRFMNLPLAPNGASAFPGLINLGNPGEVTIRQMAERVIDLTGSSSRIVSKSLPADDRMQRKPDITLVRAHPGSRQPGVQLDAVLTKTIAYFDALLAPQS